MKVSLLIMPSLKKLFVQRNIVDLNQNQLLYIAACCGRGRPVNAPAAFHPCSHPRDRAGRARAEEFAETMRRMNRIFTNLSGAEKAEVH
jgi:hypothetical protein